MLPLYPEIQDFSFITNKKSLYNRCYIIKLPLIVILAWLDNLLPGPFDSFLGNRNNGIANRMRGTAKRITPSHQAPINLGSCGVNGDAVI